MTGIGLFGLITTPPELLSAVPMVTATSLKVGVIPAVIGAITSNIGLALTTAVAALAAYITIKNIVIVAVIFAIFILVIVCNCFLGTQTD